MTASRNPPRVVHLVPRDGLGGTEAAARSLDPTLHHHVQVWFLSGCSLATSPLIRELSPRSSLRSAAMYARGVVCLWRARPEVVICSLWRSSIVGLLYKLIRPRTAFVVMLHSVRFSHFLDRLVTRLAILVAVEVWCDSQATRDVMVPEQRRTRCRVLSFLVRPPVAGERLRSLDFVFWGRLVRGKSVPRAIRIFDQVRQRRPGIRFFIFGPGGSDSPAIRQAIGEMSPPETVFLMGAKPPGSFSHPIPSCSFFILPSTHEGMAVAVVEAMQLGLVPVVTPVGEIAQYCEDGVSAVFIKSDEQAVEEIVSLIDDPDRLKRMQRAAAAYWVDKVDYSQDFFDAYTHVLESRAGSR